MKLYRHNSVSVLQFRMLFGAKLIAAVVLYMIYRHFYNDRAHADIFRYYDDSIVIYKAAFQKPFDFVRMITGIGANNRSLYVYYDQMRNWFNSEMIFNDSRTMIRLNVLMRFISLDAYFPHAVIMCFLSMCGLTGLYRVFSSYISSNKMLLAVFLYLMPSVLLWTSGMIKEAFLVFSIGMLLYSIHRIMITGKINPVDVTALVFYSFCLLNIKSYVLIIMLPCIAAWLVIEKSKWNAVAVTGVLVAVYLMALFIFSDNLTGRPIPVLMAAKQHEFYHVAATEHARTTIQLIPLDSSLTTLMRSAVPAFMVTLTRPHLLEADNILLYAAAAENLFIILGLLLALFIYFRSGKMLPSLFFPSVVLVIIMFMLIGWVTPIPGAIVRYKVPVLPFVSFILKCLSASISFKPNKADYAE